MLNSSLKIWFHHFGIMMLILVVIPATLLVALTYIPGTMDIGLMFGKYYYAIGYLLFGDWLGVFQQIFSSLPKSKTDIIGLFTYWTVICVVIASAQLAVAKYQASRKS